MASPVKYHYGKFPPRDIQWESLIPLIGPASAALARYDGVLSAVPNPNILLTPLSTQEAVLSSKIEGTQATMGEVFEFEAQESLFEGEPERKDDIHEILNYRKAMRHAVGLLDKLPLCQRVVREAHAVLMDGVRGHGKSPGEYRKIPNWIGSPGCTIEEARYVPISAAQLKEGMSAWEKYIHEDAPDRLVQLALLHAEFEAIHPFLDGNGRLGRMCVPLFMQKVGLIQQPTFYISAFFETHREEYYERLLAISRDGVWTEWCAFFLRAVTEQAQSNEEKTRRVLKLYHDKKAEIAEHTRSQYGIFALDFLFNRPIFNASDFAAQPDIPKPTATRILRILRDRGILSVLRESSGRRSAILSFPALLNIAEGREVF